MGYIQGEARGQQTLFPVALDDLIPGDHFCRVIEAFAGRLDFAALGFERAEAADTGRPGYDPRDLLKLYLYGYLQQVRSSRRLEAECRRNVEVMWLLGRLAPDHKSIAEFRRLHRAALTEAGAELVRFARSVGLVRGEWVAIDGSKFQTVSSARSVGERESMKRYLDAVEAGDEQEEAILEPSAVAAALKKLEQHPEPEARFMRTAHGPAPAYNVQIAVDAAHALVVAQEVTTEPTDNRSLCPWPWRPRKRWAIRLRSTWWRTPVIPTAHRRKPARPAASCPMCRCSAESITRETELCSIAPSSATTRPATRSAALPGSCSPARECRRTNIAWPTLRRRRPVPAAR